MAFTFLVYQQPLPITDYPASHLPVTSRDTSRDITPAPTGSLPTPSTPVPIDQVSTVTGLDPSAVFDATYGKIIPIWVGGQLRLGCHIIYGPTFRDVGGIRLADFGVSFGMPANNIGTRELIELRLDGRRVWHVDAGNSYNPLIFRFYPGTETQLADPMVIAAHPTAPVAYRGQCCVFIEGLRIADFDLKVPFVSALIADTTEPGDPEDGVNLGDAMEQIAASPYVNLSATDFATTGVSERVDAVIVAEKISFLELINRYARLFLWDIVQTDKLKIIERGTVAPDLSLDLTNILSGENSPPIVIQRQQQPDVAKELDYSWIDPDRDYEINTVTIKRPSAPVPVTAGAGKDTISLPSVHSIQEATAWATLRKFKDELARETVSLTTTAFGYELEPGDIVSVDAGFKTYILRVLETLRGANWTCRIKAEPVLRCSFPE
jgi:Putative phage tail protein